MRRLLRGLQALCRAWPHQAASVVLYGLVRIASYSERQYQAVIDEVMRSTGWVPVTRLRVRRRKR